MNRQQGQHSHLASLGYCFYWARPQDFLWCPSNAHLSRWVDNFCRSPIGLWRGPEIPVSVEICCHPSNNPDNLYHYLGVHNISRPVLFVSDWRKCLSGMEATVLNLVSQHHTPLFSTEVNFVRESRSENSILQRSSALALFSQPHYLYLSTRRQSYMEPWVAEGRQADSVLRFRK